MKYTIIYAKAVGEGNWRTYLPAIKRVECEGRDLVKIADELCMGDVFYILEGWPNLFEEFGDTSWLFKSDYEQYETD